MVDIIRSIEREQMREGIPDFQPGDTVRAMIKVVEGTRERLQAFEGVVIRRRSGGTGFGLPMVRALAAAGGASVTVDSALRQGTRVAIAFPHDRVVLS